MSLGLKTVDQKLRSEKMDSRDPQIAQIGRFHEELFSEGDDSVGL